MITQFGDFITTAIVVVTICSAIAKDKMNFQ
jgi:hypothetical protein